MKMCNIHSPSRKEAQMGLNMVKEFENIAKTRLSQSLLSQLFPLRVESKSKHGSELSSDS